MRALETLIRDHPNKTGQELMNIQAQEKLDDQKEFEARNKKVLAFIEDINTNGGYYRGRFGLDQHFFYRVFNMKMDNNGEVNMEVESLVMFYNDTENKNLVTHPNEIRIERRVKNFEQLDQYGLDDCERVTKKEWNAVNNYVNAMSTKFWEALPK